jgi:hypothetical protein
MDEIFGVFVIEAREQLDAMEAGLMQLEQGDRDPETINSVFRAAHTIKGASGGSSKSSRWRNSPTSSRTSSTACATTKSRCPAT